MYKQLWLWLTSSLGFTSKNGLNALYGSGICFPSSFLKNWQTVSFLVRFPRLCRACSLRNCGHKSWIARCTSPLGCVSRVNRRLSKESLLMPSLMNCILSHSLQIPFLKNDILHYKSIWHICDRLSVVLHDVSLQKCFYLFKTCMKWKNWRTHPIIGPLLQLASEYLQEFHGSLTISIFHT